MPVSSLSDEIQVAPPDMPELLVTCLQGLGWRLNGVNDRLQQVAASQVRNERPFTYDFLATISWRISSNGGSVVEVEIREQRNSWSVHHCQTKASELLEKIKEMAFRVVEAKEFEPKHDRYGSARWGTHEDIVNAEFLGDVDDPRRLVVGPSEDDNYVTISPDESIKHALVCGPTGCGKTSSIFIPNLIERLDASVIVTEVTAGNEKPHLYAQTSGYRAGVGRQKIYYFNPDDLNSDCINPIDSVKGYADAQNLSKLIVENTTSKNNYGDDVWPKSEMNMLSILIAHAATQKQDLGYVRSLLREGPEDLLPIMKNSPAEAVRDEYSGFLKTSREGFRYGVFASLMQRLALWVNPKVRALTSRTTIDTNVLKNELFSFYMAVPVRKTHMKPVSALIFNYIFQYAEENTLKNTMYLSLDEFTNFGLIPGLVDRLGAIRHKEIGIVFGIQDAKQLEIVYGRDAADVIMSQLGCRIFFRPRSFDVAEKISKMAGQTTVFERKVSSSGQIQEKESGRPLIDTSEVLSMPEDKMLVFTTKTPPMLMDRFTWRDYEAPMKVTRIIKPTVEVDDRLVKESQTLTEIHPWQVEGEKKRREEMKEPQLSEDQIRSEIEKELEVPVAEETLPEETGKKSKQLDEKGRLALPPVVPAPGPVTPNQELPPVVQAPKPASTATKKQSKARAKEQEEISADDRDLPSIPVAENVERHRPNADTENKLEPPKDLPLPEITNEPEPGPEIDDDDYLVV